MPLITALGATFNVNPEIDALDLYTDIVSCPLLCAGIRNDPQSGVVPRSFYCEAPLEDVEVLIVGKNPGHAPDWESRMYQKEPSSERVAIRHLEVVGDLFSKTLSVGTGFHHNLLKRVGAILGVPPEPSSVFGRCALTALVKCESSGAKTATLPNSTMVTCTERFLLREIEIYRPVYLLALGREVFDFLTSPAMARRHLLPVGNLYHPSWSNMKGGEARYFETEIPKLRQEYLNARSDA